MAVLITVLIVLASLVLAFFILVQAPKGGGLTGNFGSLSSQVMGVKQSTDVMEKGTWTTMAVIAVLSIFAVTFVDRPKQIKPTQPQQEQAPATPAAPAAGAPAPPAN